MPASTHRSAAVSPSLTAVLAALPPWYATTLVGLAGLVAAVAIVVPPVVAGGAGSAPVATAAVGTALAVAGYLGLARAAGLPPAAVFLDRPGRETLRWAAVGLASAGVLAGALALLGDGRLVVAPLDPVSIAVGLLASVGLGLWAGTTEELLLRGYVLATVGARWHWPGAVLGSAALFGLLHHGAADGPGGQLLYVGVTATAGAVFGLLTLLSGNVWNAVSFHATWNAVFSPYALAVGSAADAPAIVRYLPGAEPAILGAGLAPPTESPLVAATFLAIGVALLGPLTAQEIWW